MRRKFRRVRFEQDPSGNVDPTGGMPDTTPEGGTGGGGPAVSAADLDKRAAELDARAAELDAQWDAVQPLYKYAQHPAVRESLEIAEGRRQAPQAPQQPVGPQTDPRDVLARQYEEAGIPADQARQLAAANLPTLGNIGNKLEELRRENQQLRDSMSQFASQFGDVQKYSQFSEFVGSGREVAPGVSSAIFQDPEMRASYEKFIRTERFNPKSADDHRFAALAFIGKNQEAIQKVTSRQREAANAGAVFPPGQAGQYRPQDLPMPKPGPNGMRDFNALMERAAKMRGFKDLDELNRFEEERLGIVR